MTEDVISIVGVDVELKAEEEFNRWYNRGSTCAKYWTVRAGSGERATCRPKAHHTIWPFTGVECEEAMWTPELQSIKCFAHLWRNIDSYFGRTYRKIYHEAR